MARTTPRPRPTATQTLTPLTRYCPTCGNTMWAASHNYRTITPLTDVLRLTRKIRHCIPPDCPQVRHPYRPEAAGRLVLPKHECGLDIIARRAPCAMPSTAGCPRSLRSWHGAVSRWRPARSGISWSAMMNSSHSRWLIRSGSSG